MANRLVLTALLVFVLIAAGCTATGLSSGSATISATANESLPAGTQPAILWTVDGRQVRSGNSPYRLSAGRHAVSVVPLAYGASAAKREFDVRELTIDVKAGQNIQLAAVVRRHRTYVGTVEKAEGWQTTVMPYVIRQL